MIECPAKIQIKSRTSYTFKPASNAPSSPVKVIPMSAPTKLRFNRNEKLKERFTELSKIWHEEMDGVSSIQVRTSHWAYREVIQMGEPIVPYILEELTENLSGGWFYALAKILKHNPVQPEHKMDMNLVLEDWVRYAQEMRLDF